jgi:hypothetical protein
MRKVLQDCSLRINFLLFLFIIAAALHWPWEMLQMPAYREMAHRSWSETAWRCSLASLGDGLITIFVYGLTVMMLRSLYGETIMRLKGFISLAILGAMAAIAIERLALSAGRWSYSTAMPIVPIFDVGFLPLLQLVILIPLAVKIAFLSFHRCLMRGATAPDQKNSQSHQHCD